MNETDKWFVEFNKKFTVTVQKLRSKKESAEDKEGNDDYKQSQDNRVEQ